MSSHHRMKGQAVTLYLADISSAQRGLRIRQLDDAGIAAVIIKCTEAGGYVNPWYRDWLAEAQNLGLPCTAYHFVHPVNEVPADVQARNIAHADPDPAVPVWMDDEAGAGLADGYAVADALRSLGQTVAGVYNGSRPLPGYGGWWRAAYLGDPAGYAADVYHRQGGDTGPGWVNGVDLWQYCQHGRITTWNGDLDFTAYRGTLVELLSHQDWFWTPAGITPARPKDDDMAQLFARGDDTGRVYQIEQTVNGLRAFYVPTPEILNTDLKNGATMLAYPTEAALTQDYPISGGTRVIA